MTAIALCFPGQGSQAQGMASGLIDLPAAAQLLEVAASEGLDLTAALGGDDSSLRATDVAQPALLFVEIVLTGLVSTPGLDVVGVAGHSVGEYTALVAAGALDAADAMRAVIARGRAMAAMRQGTMAALLGAEVALAEEVCAAVSQTGVGPVVVANVNAPGQVVISGTVEGVEASIAMARERGVRKAMRLNVGGAFHSPLMRDAAAGFEPVVAALPLRDARFPVVCNVDGTAVTDAGGLRARLRSQLVSAVRWTDCVTTLVGLGAEALVEVGPGGVLTGLARRIVPGTRALAVADGDAAAGLTAALAAVAHA